MNGLASPIRRVPDFGILAGCFCFLSIDGESCHKVLPSEGNKRSGDASSLITASYYTTAGQVGVRKKCVSIRLLLWGITPNY